jgi:phosphotransferase system, enzyme I, PtsP
MSPQSKNKPSTNQFGITTLEDISTLILQSHDLDETLNNIVTLVARRMRTEVCSIYLLEDDGHTCACVQRAGFHAEPSARWP